MISTICVTVLPWPIISRAVAIFALQVNPAVPEVVVAAQLRLSVFDGECTGLHGLE